MTRLTGASVRSSGPQMTLTWITDEPLLIPKTGHWTLSMTFSGAADGPMDQVGFKHVDGRWVGTWVFDHNMVRQVNYHARPTTVGNKWRLVVPRYYVRPQSGNWTAALDLDGHDAGAVDGQF